MTYDNAQLLTHQNHLHAVYKKKLQLLKNNLRRKSAEKRGYKKSCCKSVKN